MPELSIRPAEFADLDALYDVCLRTGAAGADATGRYADGDLLGHVYVGPYVLLESGFGLVLTVEAAVVGYALATADTTAFEAEAADAWWPALRRRYPLPGAGNDAELVALIHDPPTAARDVVGEFPAHLHIDVLPEAQGLGAGRRLMEAVEAELGGRGASGVHLGVDPANTRAQAFYEHLGYRRAEHAAGVVFVKPLP